MPTIQKLQAREILDSRGTPTLSVRCTFTNGLTGCASVPSGRSTGANEALELRDGDPKRYRGKGCRRAVAQMHEVIHPALSGQTVADQSSLDQRLIELDGTVNKSNLGANAILGASLAFARAAAQHYQQPLFSYFANLLNHTPATIPRLTINLFSGGHHAGQQVSVQDVLVVPASSTTVDQSLTMTHAVYHTAFDQMASQYGMRWLTADEGGLAPPVDHSEAMLSAAVAAIEGAGLTPGEDVHLAMDVAASHFYADGHYQLDGLSLTPEQMIDRLAQWQAHYPLISIEDGLSEDDWWHWPGLTKRLNGNALVLGDDLLCTNPKRIQRAIDQQSCNALLLKVNQVGTLTEAAQAYQLARQAGWGITLSVRSGETEDDWAADLAVGWGADHFKNGSITQSERLAKYNRLLEIELDHGLTHAPDTTAVM
jgi:enolase